MIREANTLDNYAFCYYAVDSLIQIGGTGNILIKINENRYIYNNR